MTGTSASPAAPRYERILTLGNGTEWRFNPLVADFNKDGHVDLAATARRAGHALHIWLGDGNGAFTELPPAWTDTGYAALAAGDINRDGSVDIVGASHFGQVQTLLNDGKARFVEKIMEPGDGYVAAQLADLNGDGRLDLVLGGYQKAGVQIYLGDGQGNWSLHRTLPDPKPGRTLPGRAVAIGDLNRDRHLDLVAAFQRWGIYIYYGDGRGSFAGGRVDFSSNSQEFHSIVLGDVNKDQRTDIVINGAISEKDQPNGPDVYLGDGRGAWKPSSAGLEVLRFASAGIAIGDLDRDGIADLVAGGNDKGRYPRGYGLFWFRGDADGSWELIRESGLPVDGLTVPHSVTLADLDRDRVPEIIALNGSAAGSITIWKQQPRNAPTVVRSK